MTDNPVTTVTLVAEESTNIDIKTYRGSASLAALSRLSQADVYDQDANPEGLQRDLNIRHARDAYDYVAAPADRDRPRAYPEVLLNVRDRKVVEVEKHEVELGERKVNMVTLTFDLAKIERGRGVKVSRVDGNHRLMFGAGDGKDRKALEEVTIPFALTMGMPREHERSIFTDVNAEQKGLNTSHLAVQRARLTPQERLLATKPERVFAVKLAEDEGSPFAGLVHMGGSKEGARKIGLTRPITFVALEGGVRRLLRRSMALGERTPDAQYAIIRNYWQAVKEAMPEAWAKDNDLLVLKNIGINTFAQLGGQIIDHALLSGDVEASDMVPLVKAAAEKVNWHRDSEDVAGMSGNRAVLQLAGRMAEGLPKLAPAQRAELAHAHREVAKEDAAPGEAEGDEAKMSQAEREAAADFDPAAKEEVAKQEELTKEGAAA